MLVIHPASTCDVCLESYAARPQKVPCSITCGHVFCLDCLKSLRQQNCPLCRSPFDVPGLRRLHVDRNDAQYPVHQRTPSPLEQRAELPPDNALGLVDDIPRATRLQRKISDLVLRSSFTNGVRERGIREFIQEIHAFLSAEPQELHTDLRAEFLLLYRFTELQARYQQLETTAFDLRTESSRCKQSVIEWERRYEDLQQSRARDQDSARIVEASLRERLRIEELEWQRKYDFVSDQCAKLSDELERLRFSSSVRDPSQAPRRSTSATQLLHLVAEGSSSNGMHSDRRSESLKAKDEVDIFNHFDPSLFHLSPVPPKISLSDSSESFDSDDDIATQKHRRRAPESPSRTSSTSSNISRASESAAALKLYSSAAPLQANRHRSDSYPTRSAEKEKIYYSENQREVATSMPNSYMYRAASPTRALFPTTPPPPDHSEQDNASHDPLVQAARHYSVSNRPAIAADPRFTNISNKVSRVPSSGTDARPALPRSTSFQLFRTTDLSTSSPDPTAQNTLAARRAHPPMVVQTSALSATRFQRGTASSPQTPTQDQSQTQAAADAISPIQRTPPRPVLPHMHSYLSLYSPPAKPVSPKETRTGARGTLPRRGSLSSASAAAQAARTGSSGVIPPSSLGSRRSNGQGLFGGQDSDA